MHNLVEIIELILTPVCVIDIDDPIQPAAIPSAAGSSATEPSADKIAMIGDMGFSPAQARKALKQAVRDYLCYTQLI